MIVHANAGYSHLTGFESDITIGQPLMEFMTLANGNKISLKHCVIMSELGNNVIVEILTNPSSNNENSNIKCSLTAYPVMSNSNSNQKGSDEDESSKGLLSVSHYVLDMITCQKTLPFSNATDGQIMNETKLQSIAIKPIAVTMG